MRIFYGKQYLDQNDIKSVVSACRSDRITQGKYVEKFERDL